MIKNLTINRPIPYSTEEDLEKFDGSTDIGQTIKTLEAGKAVLIRKFYSNGTTLLRALQNHLNRTLPNKTFVEQRAFRAKYRALSNKILIEIENHKLSVKKAPTIGWLEKLYPEMRKFLLTFPQVQGLNSSWQWYTNGIAIPVLRNKLKPYYGTYFPTRFDHLILFDNWLKRYEGQKKAAYDVGIGSGVLSFQLVKHGFQKVFATDTNPNAILGLQEFMGDTKLSRKIELDYGNLFGSYTKPTELIVFNPPWLPASGEIDNLDEAIYYNEDLFPTFFQASKERLLPDGKLVLLFSNLAQITKLTKEHPIEDELTNGGRFQLERKLTRPVKLASSKTNRDQHWRNEEEVELWILSHK